MNWEWLHRKDKPLALAHARGIGWPRTLCGLRAPITMWVNAPAEHGRCGACQRRVETAKHWTDVLMY